MNLAFLCLSVIDSKTTEPFSKKVTSKDYFIKLEGTVLIASYFNPNMSLYGDSHMLFVFHHGN